MIMTLLDNFNGKNFFLPTFSTRGGLEHPDKDLKFTTEVVKKRTLSLSFHKQRSDQLRDQTFLMILYRLKP